MRSQDPKNDFQTTIFQLRGGVLSGTSDAILVFADVDFFQKSRVLVRTRNRVKSVLSTPSELGDKAFSF